jgi:hypothetical protein
MTPRESLNRASSLRLRFGDGSAAAGFLGVETVVDPPVPVGPSHYSP